MKRTDACVSLLIDPLDMIEEVFEWCVESFGSGFLIDEVRVPYDDVFSSGWPMVDRIRFTSSEVNAVLFKLRWSEFIQ